MHAPKRKKNNLYILTQCAGQNQNFSKKKKKLLFYLFDFSNRILMQKQQSDQINLVSALVMKNNVIDLNENQFNSNTCMYFNFYRVTTKIVMPLQPNKNVTGRNLFTSLILKSLLLRLFCSRIRFQTGKKTTH